MNNIVTTASLGLALKEETYSFLFIIHCKPLVCQNSDSQVIDQNAFGQLDCKILLKCNVSRKK